jgi:hypothetical protein
VTMNDSGASNPSEYVPTVCGLNKKELLKDVLNLFGQCDPHKASVATL